MIKKALLVAALLLSPGIAQAAPYLADTPCSTLGETHLDDNGAEILACLNLSATNQTTFWKSMTSSVPVGTVAAFELASCPIGWSARNYLSGRSLVAAGSAAGLTPRNYGETGGEETHTITLSEMPKHTHTLAARWSDAGAVSGGNNKLSDPAAFAAGGLNNVFPDRTTTPSGLGTAINVMSPYVVLTFCEKD